MRKYLSTILFCFLALFSFSQSHYVPLPDSNATWRTDYYSEDDCDNPGFPFQSYQYYENGDTVYNGLTYRKVYQTGIQQCFNQISYFDYYSGGIRQDSINKKVYFLGFAKMHDTLLYDFNLKVGDTLPGTYINYANAYVVDSIDSVKISGAFHRRFYIRNYNLQNKEPFIIEGVGNIKNGLLEEIEVPNGITWHFICFSQNGKFEYGDSSNCSLILGVNNVVQQNSIKLFPTICSISQPLHFSIPDYFLNQKITLTIYKSDGSLIKNISSNEIKNENSISLSDYGSGIYFYSIHSQKQVVKSGTFIIQ